MSAFKRFILVACGSLLVTFAMKAQPSQKPEFRAFWVSAWNEGYCSVQEVSNLVSSIRTANANAIFIEVRKRGDAYYKGSPFEPEASIVTTAFDPLAEVIRQAHDTNAGPRIEVHAWFVAYPLLNVNHTTNYSSVERSRANPKHPFNLYPNWRTQSDVGQKSDGDGYQLDPGHPEAQKYLYQVAMDIISRYDIDGFHFDHVRYSTEHWGYNPTAVSRFNTLFHRSGNPKYNDPDWSQFRRDQISALIRKVYLSATALKPSLKISASTITWAPGIHSDEQWTERMPYKSALQDWQAWMQEGILDINVPMAFFKQATAAHAEAYAEWVTYAENHQYDRHVVIGQAGYLNSFAGTIVQIKTARHITALTNKAEGLALYSYAVPCKGASQKFTFFKSAAESFFQIPVQTPEMPWKTKPTKGHLMGFVYGDKGTNTLDGAKISLIGPTERKLTADGTGFYGAVDLPPGSYTLMASFFGYQTMTNTIQIETGKVLSSSINLVK